MPFKVAQQETQKLDALNGTSMLRWSPLHSKLSHHLLKDPVALQCQLVVISNHEVVIHIAKEMNSFASCSLSHLIGQRLTHPARLPRRVEIAERKGPAPHETTCPRVTHH